ncbi:hypothetical protein INT44_004360 [Umbelopsis vinacea]|uniref:Uncharacterized protein n=1 Tax=Umbelopsis vinacea TaxID=44442 RepID=A0A8H7URC4_9FUNG|nr:hypothetical protein INT44_004360 [Umbelopsis vinacea]
MADDDAFGAAFDDDIFLSEKVRNPIESLQEQKAKYTAKQDDHGWFHSGDSVAYLMQTKLGPNQIKMSIEHDYLHKNYQRALQAALAYIAAVEDDSIDCKITNPKEIVEAAALCAWKLGDMKTAVECADKLNSRELGSLQTRGIVYMHGERYTDAIACFVEYNRNRHLDYKPWRYMASTFLKSFNEEPKASDELVLHVAHASVQRALRILSSSRWPTVEFARKRCQAEYDDIKALQQTIVNLGGSAQDYFDYMSTHGDVAPESLQSFHWEDIIWINEECKRIAGNKDAQEEEPKSVREL